MTTYILTTLVAPRSVGAQDLGDTCAGTFQVHEVPRLLLPGIARERRRRVRQAREVAMDLELLQTTELVHHSIYTWVRSDCCLEEN